MKKLILLMVILLVGCSSSTVSVGEVAYDFEVESYDGELVRLSDFDEQLYIVAWSTT